MKSHANNAILPVYPLCRCYPLCDVDSHRTACLLFSELQTHMHTDRAMLTFDSLPPKWLKRLHLTSILPWQPGLHLCYLLETMALATLPWCSSLATISLSWVTAISVQTPQPLELPLPRGRGSWPPSISSDLTFLSLHPSWPLRCSECFC